MPRPEDFTLLWWANGPEKFHSMRTPPSEAVLCMQSGTIGLAIDTRTVRLLHAGRFAKPKDTEGALRQGNAAVFALPPVALELNVQHGDRTFTCIGRGALPRDDFYYPVRFVESGRFLQRVAIEGLEFADPAGNRLEAKGWLEIALWPDRAVLSFALETTNAPPDGELVLVAGGRRASQSLGTRQPAVLELFGPKNPQRPTVEAYGALRLKPDEETGCTVLELPRPQWKNVKGTYYPEEELDRLDRWRFTVRNDSEREATLPIMFADDHPPAITGFTPMLCDADGTPDRHPGADLQELACAARRKASCGIKGRGFTAARSCGCRRTNQREFSFTLAYARYGGVPAASHAQLSPHRLGAQPVLGSGRHRQLRRKHLLRAGPRAAPMLH